MRFCVVGKLLCTRSNAEADPYIGNWFQHRNHTIYLYMLRIHQVARRRGFRYCAVGAAAAVATVRRSCRHGHLLPRRLCRSVAGRA